MFLSCSFLELWWFWHDWRKLCLNKHTCVSLFHRLSHVWTKSTTELLLLLERPGRQDVRPAGATFGRHGCAPGTHRDARKSSTSLSEEGRTFPRWAAYSRNKEPDKTSKEWSTSERPETAREAERDLFIFFFSFYISGNKSEIWVIIECKSNCFSWWWLKRYRRKVTGKNSRFLCFTLV